MASTITDPPSPRTLPQGQDSGEDTFNMGTRVVQWSEGVWTHPPAALQPGPDGTDLFVRACEGSDAWRHTSYGFVRDTAHALLLPLQPGTAVEITFVAPAASGTQFDQAGVYLAVSGDAERWIKAGIERFDGALHLGAVVTHGESDWSAAPVPEWAERRVTVRASRAHGAGAITIRARVDGDSEGWRLVRLAPLVGKGTDVLAGPYCCAPTPSSVVFEVRFLSWVVTPADASLH